MGDLYGRGFVSVSKNDVVHSRGARPLGIAFFKVGLDSSKLSQVHRLIMRLAMFSLPEIQIGDYLNPVIIGHWGGD